MGRGRPRMTERDRLAKLVYQTNRLDAEYPDKTCWACLRLCRNWSDRPDWWFGPWFLHRAHIVSQPRREDRRGIILLCPICHGIQHGERFPQVVGWDKISLAELLWIKRTRDPEWFDLEWLQRHSIRRLPEPEDFLRI